MLVSVAIYFGAKITAPQKSPGLLVPEAAAATLPPASYPTPAAIQPVLQDLGISQDIAKHIQFDVPQTAASCGSVDVSGAAACENGNVITVPVSVLSQPRLDRNAIVAHEYLHYIWSITPQSEKDTLTPYINQAYQNAAPYLDQRISGYDFTKLGDATRINELHSFEGSEISDSLIPAPLLAHYRQYLPSRSALPSYYPYPVRQQYVPPVYIAPTYVPIYTPPPVYTPTCHDYGLDYPDPITGIITHHPNVQCF